MRRPHLFGPLLPFELTAFARKIRYYILRGVYVGILWFLLYVVYQATVAPHLAASGSGPTVKTQIRAQSELATSFFQTFGFAQLIALLVLTPALLAPAITTERERRTIDYLLTTDLSSREIVLGKWMARSLAALLPVWAGLGVAGVCQFFGGIDIENVFVLAFITVSALVVTSAVSLMVSVRAKRTRDSLLGAYFVLGLLLGAPHLMHAVVSTIDSASIQLGKKIPRATIDLWQARADYLGTAEPLTLFSRLVVQGKPGPGGATNDLAFMAKVHGAVAAVCLFWAMFTLRRRVRNETGPRRSLWKVVNGFLRVPPIPQGFLTEMIWKEIRFASTGGFWLTVVVGGLLVSYSAVQVGEVMLGSRNGRFDDSLRNSVRFTTAAMAIWTVLMVLVQAATSIATERSQDTWVSLLSTGISARRIAYGKVVGAMRPLALMLVFLAPICGLAWFFTTQIDLPVLLVVGSAFVFAFFFAAVGVNQSLARKSSGGAIGSSFGFFFLINGLGQVLLLLLVVVLVLAFQSIPREGETYILYAFVESIPVVLIVGALESNGNWLNQGDAKILLGIGAGWMLFYLLASIGLVELTARSFPEVTGRPEGPYEPPGFEGDRPPREPAAPTDRTD